MRKPAGPTVIRVVVTLAIIAAGLFAVQELFSCRPPHDEADMIKLFEADPLVATAPAGGRLVEQYSHTYTCDSGHGYSSPTGPGFAEVRRHYKTPAGYSADQLRQRFGGPAAAGGWHYLLTRGPTAASGGSGSILYCKETGERTAIAHIRSSALKPTGADVEVRLSGIPRRGQTCDDELRSYARD